MNTIRKHKKLTGLTTTVAYAALALSSFPGGLTAAPALPTGGHVVSGNAAIHQNGPNGLQIDQSSRAAIINWGGFSIGEGGAVHFANGTGATLNRVTGGLPSRIDGSLTATGGVYLVNQAGVVVGKEGRIDTGGSFVASTHDVSDSAFLAGGDLLFSGNSDALVINAGQIGSLGGDVALIARRVENTGKLTAPQGAVALAAGYEVLARDAALSDGKFLVRIGGSGTAALNAGAIEAAAAELRANGGNVYALAGNTAGIIKATAVNQSGGRIIFDAGSTGAVELAGTIDASAQSGTGILPVSVASQSAPAPSGGLITATGQTITVKSGATLDASGATGGKILLGGDYQGGKNAASNFAPDGLTLATASATTVEAGSLLRADGLAGDGGNIVVWADHLTTYAGHLSAQALGLTGDGGFAEVSGKAVLDFTGTADLRAAHGATGLLLLDPYNVTISTGTDAGGGLGSDPTGTSVINRTTLQNALASANVLVTTGGAGSAGGQAGDIFVNADLEWSSGTTLELSAYRNITVNAVIDAGSGSVILRSDNSGTGDGTVIFPTGGNGHIIAIGGVKIYFNPKVNTDLDPSVRNNVNPYSYAAPTENFAANLATGTPYQGYMLVNTLYDLQNVDNNRTGARQGQGASASGRLGYALSRDIDASETWEWNSGNGFQHIGASGGSTYSAPVFDGQGHVISNLYMQRAGSSPVGLFGFISGSETVPVQIVNLGLVGGTISGGGQGTGSQALGGLVGGATNAVIQNSFVYGTKISGTSVYAIGGLLGYINGGVVIKDSFAIADLTLVSGSGNTQGYGGLVGGLYGSGNIIESSFFAGQLPASNSGALIGRANSGASATLTNLYWDTSTTTRPAIGTNTANLPVTGAIGLSHEDMAVAASFAGFDFTGAGPWSAPGSLSSFPVLKVFGDRDYNALLRFLPVTYSFGSPLSWEYGNDHDLALIHYDLDGLQGDDAATVRGILQLTNSSGARVTLSALTNAGTYTLSILGLVGEGAVAYRIADTGNTPGTLTITPAPLTITLVDLEKEYGTLIANPSAAAGAGDAWVASVTGLKNGEALSQLTVRSLGFEAAADGNAYAITGTGAAFLRGTGSVPASNYNITYVPGTLTVQNVPGGAINYVTYQFGSNYSWTYGQDDRGQITWSLRNPLNADVTDVTGVLVIKQGATEVTDLTRLNAGSYQLTIGSLAGENASNYTIDHAHSQPGSLTVNKASVHYVFGQPSYSWTYGQDDRSQITWTFKDANNEEIVVAGSLAIRSDSTDVTAQTVLSRGTYNLTVNSTDTNYQVDTSASIPATLTVNGIPLTVTLRDIFKGLDELTTWDEGQVGTRYIEGDLLSLFLQSVDGLLDGHTLNRIRTVISDSDTENVRTVDLYRVVSTGAFSSLTIRVVEADGTQIAWTDVYDLTLIPGSITFTDNPSTVKEVIYDFSGNAVTGWVYGSDNRGNITWTLKDSDNTVLTESGHQVAGVLAIKQGGTDVTAQTLLNAGTYELHIGSLTGANAGDYRIAATGNTPGSLTVSKALLTLKANDGLSKVYGDVFTFLGTEYAISAGQLYGTDAITGVTLTSDGAAATAGVNGGAAWAVTASDATGSGLSNYEITYTPGQLTVTPAALTIKADDRTKDFGQTFTFAGTEFTVTGLKNSDEVASATLASDGAATGAAIDSYAITIADATGTGLENYTISYEPGTLTVQAVLTDVTYAFGPGYTWSYGDTPGTITWTLDGLIGADADTVTGVLAVQNSAGATVTLDALLNAGSYTLSIGSLTGDNSENYRLAATGNTLGSLVITPRVLTIATQGTVLGTKVYDGTTALEILTHGLLANVVNGDSVGLALAAAYADKNAGEGKSVTGTYALTNNDAGNYTLTGSTAFTGTAGITAKSITVGTQGTVSSKTYDGTTAATVATHGALAGLIAGDTVNLTLGGVTFASKNAGSQSVSGAYTIDGADAGNYTLAGNAFTGTATITPKQLTIGTAGTVATNKVYDGLLTIEVTGNGELSGVITGDTVSIALGNTQFADKNVGNGKAVTGTYTLGGADVGNYTLASTAFTGTSSITPASLTIGTQGTVAGTKIYDGTTAIEILTDGAVAGLIGSDSVSLALAAAYADRNVGEAKDVLGTYTLGGTDAGNYILTTDAFTGAATITAATLTYIANPASRVEGAANPAFTGSVTGFVGDETLATATTGSLIWSSPANTASGPGSYAINGGGLEAQNYVFVQAEGNATALTITAKTTQPETPADEVLSEFLSNNPVRYETPAGTGAGASLEQLLEQFSGEQKQESSPGSLTTDGEDADGVHPDNRDLGPWLKIASLK